MQQASSSGFNTAPRKLHLQTHWQATIATTPVSHRAAFWDGLD